MNEVPRRQHHAVVEFIGDRLGPVLERNEIEDVAVIVELALNFDGGAVVVAVQAFTLVTFVADEVAGAEDQVVLGDADFEAFRHGRHRRTFSV